MGKGALALEAEARQGSPKQPYEGTQAGLFLSSLRVWMHPTERLWPSARALGKGRRRGTFFLWDEETHTYEYVFDAADPHFAKPYTQSIDDQINRSFSHGKSIKPRVSIH